MSVIKGLFFLCCLSLYSSSASGAEALRSSSIPQVKGIQFDRLALISGSGVAFRYLGYRYVDRAWYQGQKQDHIRWIQDWSGDTYLNLDKGGHFMAGLFVAQTLNDAYTWSGFRPRTAAVLGTLTSWVALLEVEMRDAYFDQWGFSVPDFSANTIGASIPLVYAFFPATRAVGFKFSYHPSQLYRQRRERAAAPAAGLRPAPAQIEVLQLFEPRHSHDATLGLEADARGLVLRPIRVKALPVRACLNLKPEGPIEGAELLLREPRALRVLERDTECIARVGTARRRRAKFLCGRRDVDLAFPELGA